MKVFLLFLLISPFVCQIDDSDQDPIYIPDLVTWYLEDGNWIQLEAFSHPDNDKNLKENNTRKLKWYSIGHPILQKTIYTKKERFFHIGPRGVFTHVQFLLTNRQLKELGKVAKFKYNLDFELNHIENFLISSVNCTIHLHDPNNATVESDFRGSVKSFLKLPLRINFDANKDSTEIKLFKKNFEFEEDLEVECTIKSNNLKNFRSELILSTENIIQSKSYDCGLKFEKNIANEIILTDDSNFDCNYGGICSCQNDGKCKVDGNCECKNGFTGYKCQTYIGCQANGTLSCLNGGTCLSNGFCSCNYGYKGSTCEKYLGCNFGEYLACQNSGTCLTNGSCECKIGFTGNTCQTYIGCQAKGTLSCLNGGTCLSNGFCSCIYGYKGSTCEKLPFNPSIFLNMDESTSLYGMLSPFQELNLLYRSSRDGLSFAQFKTKCSDKENLVIIIKNNLNYIFGGYASIKWNTTGSSTYLKDPNAFIFSLRRNGISNNAKFKIRNSDYSICEPHAYIAFGEGLSDIYIDSALSGGHTHIGHSYELPVGYTYDSTETKNYLAGSFSEWTVQEIEVYQVI